jgi:hypothetical protein
LFYTSVKKAALCWYAFTPFTRECCVDKCQIRENAMSIEVADYLSPQIMDEFFYIL